MFLIYTLRGGAGSDMRDDKPNSKKAPVYGLLSIGIPVVGFLLCLLAIEVMASRGRDGWGFGRFFVFLGIMLLASLSGGVCVLLAFGRNEKYWILPVLGIILSLGPLLWLFSRMK